MQSIMFYLFVLLNVVMLAVFMLTVIMLGVVALFLPLILAKSCLTAK
jgi:hypothetical protein